MPEKRRKPNDDPASVVTASSIGNASAESGDGTGTGGKSVGDGRASGVVSKQWATLRKRVDRDFRDVSPRDVFGDSVRRGALYRWGQAAAIQQEIGDALQWLSRLACGSPVRSKHLSAIDVDFEIHRFQDSLTERTVGLQRSAVAVVWAAAMPSLLHRLNENQWWMLLGILQDYREGMLNQPVTEPESLVGVAELGLTLAWSLRALPSCDRLDTSSLEALMRWAEQDDLSVTASIRRPQDMRLVLASVLRCRALLDHVGQTQSGGKGKSKSSHKKRPQSNQRLKEALERIGIELSTWSAATTRGSGQHVFAGCGKKAFADDIGKNGLLMSAAQLDRDSLEPAVKAALGQSQASGRLAWQVCLPETLMHEEDARFACLLPEWDVRRGRMVVRYDDNEMQLEMLAGKTPLISGGCETEIRVDSKILAPDGEWVSTCEYTDDDVHYLEWEQPYQGGYVLQRQLMLVREDRCCFLADAVLRSGGGGPSGNTSDSNADPSPPGEIEYQLRLPLADAIEVRPEAETSELLLANSQAQAVVLPLAAEEWRASRSTMRLDGTDDRHLLVRASGKAGLYTPIWFDLNRGRLHRERTWRKLTVAEQLAIIPPERACAFRIQIGKRQWVLYRSLAGAVPRTFMGKHMIADFYAARFDGRQQNYEDLITVEDQAR